MTVPNLANLVTCFRLLLIPLVAISYHSPWVYGNLLAACLFSLASLSDWLDGYLARRFALSSEFGAFLDPVADKLLVVTVLIMLVGEHRLLLLPAIIIIARELLISALREWMAGKGQRDAVAVAFAGKLKTTCQMIAIILLMLVTADRGRWLLLPGYLMIAVAALLSLYSAWCYFRAARPYLFP